MKEKVCSMLLFLLKQQTIAMRIYTLYTQTENGESLLSIMVNNAFYTVVNT